MSDDTTAGDASAVAADGTVVEIYRRLPSLGELEHIRSLLRPNSSVLDLGAGTGRVADPLAQLGHRVVAVDDSPDMLANVRYARKVQARIEDLRLAEKFDAVLLIGNMVNYLGTSLRRSVLATVAFHVAPSGQAIIQWAPPSLLAARPAGWAQTTTIGAVTTTLTIQSNRDGVCQGEFTLAADGRLWRQPVTMEQVSPEALRAELARAGLVLTTADPDATPWLHATPRP
ncbi:class I SAM-dependent methyltransferase [Mycobacterium shinjukuense]|uniref:Uncharacterized protein n=1 Tax=Mycobacterium shinjukuense TaxID=398694 RepID=A0A7I7MS90_9MYCO|nr:class I SAM-dependent methyltransferase [Mycobacterium shinjukuense]MCV6986883.1 class I SAM-dependent methyltransferase [Mycobacterium shinjukuense]ORB72062.1 SAM-dependent methyltransferase [Mycobacterium shinjukuense]BBX74830.1 hypothetical protein MSHI_27360 [Mycobacterium shinjukuense]